MTGVINLGDTVKILAGESQHLKGVVLWKGVLKFDSIERHRLKINIGEGIPIWADEGIVIRHHIACHHDWTDPDPKRMKVFINNGLDICWKCYNLIHCPDCEEPIIIHKGEDQPHECKNCKRRW